MCSVLFVYSKPKRLIQYINTKRTINSKQLHTRAQKMPLHKVSNVLRSHHKDFMILYCFICASLRKRNVKGDSKSSYRIRPGGHGTQVYPFLVGKSSSTEIDEWVERMEFYTGLFYLIFCYKLGTKRNRHSAQQIINIATVSLIYV